MTEKISISTVIRDRAALNPERIAIRDGAKEITYGRFAFAIRQVALALTWEGITPGSRLGIEAPGLYPHWVALMAVLRLGGEAASLTGPARAARAATAGLDAVLSTDAQSPLRDAAPKFIHYHDDWINRTAAAAADKGVELPDPALANRTLGRVVFSSGATGTPKAIMKPAEMLRTMTQEAAQDINENTKIFCGYGIGAQPKREIATWFRGGTVICPYDPRSAPRELADAINHSTYVITTPVSLVAILSAHGGLFEGRENRLIKVGGAPLPRDLRDDALKRLCSRIEIGYGASEISSIARGDAMLLDRHPGAVGFAIEGVEVQIVDENGKLVLPGTEGTLRARASYMTAGYIGDPETTGARFRDGWFYPGDVGFMEEDGLIVLLGRDTDLTIVGGAKFAPDTLEHELRQIPGIKDACALAVANRSGVNAPVILAVAEDGADCDALEKRVREKMDAAALPGSIIRWTDEIPRGSRDKPLRQKLAQEMRERLWG